MQSKQLTKLRQLNTTNKNHGRTHPYPWMSFLQKRFPVKSYLRCESFLGSSLYLESEQIAARLKWNTECSTFSSLPFSFSFPHHHHHHHNIHNFHNISWYSKILLQLLFVCWKICFAINVAQLMSWGLNINIQPSSCQSFLVKWIKTNGHFHRNALNQIITMLYIRIILACSWRCFDIFILDFYWKNISNVWYYH